MTPSHPDVVGSGVAAPLPTHTPTDDALATVVDIRRFSIHDGAGIRTTVFLKGCPLACVWCQNPETISPRIEPVFFPKTCIGCGKCVEKSSNGEAIRDSDGAIAIDTTAQGNWQAIIDACPTGAIRWNATSYRIPELVELLLRDRPFFRNGGGVTLSGGEPLFRPKVAIELLRQLHAQHVDTAIETALHVKTSAIAEAAEHLDTIFADIKIFDSIKHAAAIGRGNSLVLENIHYLLTSSHREKVVVRTPLIPGYTTDPENIRAIGHYLRSLNPDVRWELLNYNPLAGAKYDQVPDREFAYAAGKNPPLYTEDEMKEFRDLARSTGVRRIVEQ